MLPVKLQAAPLRKDDRVILHFDYDCFYASVFEADNPALKNLPLAVQQKQIIVTCNYEARKRGLRKLQLIKDARQTCPDVVIILGEDISPFRDASKKLYRFLYQFSWNDRAERLGFDEVWLDVTDMIKYNIALLNPHDLARSFFMLDKDDPTKKFSFDANCYEGPTEANDSSDLFAYDHDLTLRLKLGSHLASHIRKELERQTGYTSTVGVSTSKLLSKLVGNLHKPKDQTTLMPPYVNRAGRIGNVEPFISDYEIGKIPGIGSKLAQKIRQHVLQHEPDFEKGLIYGETKERVTVRDVRLAPGMSSETLEKILAGPGSPYGIGDKIWSLLHGVDDSEVNFAKAVPNQISIEDSYIRLDTLPEVYRELKMLSCSLIERMRVDLVTVSDDAHTLADSAKNEEQSSSKSSGRWLAQPKTIRLSTRPRLPLNPDGTRTRSFKRISHSATMPNFALSLTDPIDALAEKLVHETLIGMFRKLHPEKAGWNLSLVNIAVTNMVETGGESRTAKGRDIGSMFRRQETVHKEFRIYDGAEEEGIEPLLEQKPQTGFTEPTSGAETRPSVDTTAFEPGDGWVDDEEMAEDDETCGVCGMLVPLFAMSAHARFHQAS